MTSIKINRILLALIFGAMALSKASAFADTVSFALELNIDFGIACSYRLASSDGNQIIEGVADAKNGKRIRFTNVPSGKYKFAVLSLMLLEQEFLFVKDIEVEKKDDGNSKVLTVTNDKKKMLKIGLAARYHAPYLLNKGYVRIERLQSNGLPDYFRACASVRTKDNNVIATLFGLEPGVYRVTLVCPIASEAKPIDVFSIVVLFKDGDFDDEPLRVEMNPQTNQ